MPYLFIFVITRRPMADVVIQVKESLDCFSPCVAPQRGPFGLAQFSLPHVYDVALISIIFQWFASVPGTKIVRLYPLQLPLTKGESTDGSLSSQG